MARSAEQQTGSSLKRRNPGLQARASDVKTFDGVHEMNTNTVVDMRKFVEARNGEDFTTTQNVADAFGKLHKDVLRKVESLDCSADFTERNFTLSEYVDGSGRRLPQWSMTKDGFMFLVMGFTGKKAAAIKEGYISAFNWMAEQLGLSGRTLVAKAVEEALGAEGARIISNVIRCRVAKLDVDNQRSAAMKMSSALHARFGVPRIELIPVDQMDAACNFIAAYAIEGEYIERGTTQQSPRLSIHFPVEALAGRREGMLTERENGHAWLDVALQDVSYSYDSPCELIIFELQKAGYDVDAAQWELATYRNKLRAIDSFARGLNRVIEDPQRYAITHGVAA